MKLADASDCARWRAELDLRFDRRGTRSVLAVRRQDGPLALQKPL